LGKGRWSVEAVNSRLKAAGVPIQVRQVGRALYLRSSRFPAKAGHESGRRYQIAQGPAEQNNLARIENEAHRLWREVVEGRFDWAEHDPKQRNTDTVAHWVEALREQRLRYGECSPQTWDKHWATVFRELPQQVPLTEAVILDAVLKTPDNSRTRRRACQQLSRLAEVAGLTVDLRQHQGGYGRGSVQRRELPTDEQIEAWYENIPSAPWRIIFARLVCFGLRPSESFSLRLLDPYTAEVMDAKALVPRETKAFHPRWAEQWALEGDLPKIKWRDSSRAKDITDRIATQFYRYGIKECDRYDFRHAWCVRVSVEYEIPVEVAAAWAGHSADVHMSVYARWMRRDTAAKVYQRKALGASHS